MSRDPLRWVIMADTFIATNQKSTVSVSVIAWELSLLSYISL